MEWFGYIAAVLTTISFLPQLLHILKVRDTKSISLYMYILLVSGILMWLIYGIYLNSMPIIVANLITMIFSSIILFIKVVNVINGE